jgi:tetratricopeptide (TPR) repeat protein
MRGRPVLLGLAIVLATIAAYAPLRGNGFVRIDDPTYIVDNPHLAHGLSLDTVAWALRPGYASNWHPLTWISHALDVSLWGLEPWPHHATNLLFHVAGALLLFALLRRATKREGASLLVALVFALHPLHVESVAWASERKDVLSTALGFAALLTWAAWTERGGTARYLAALALYALSLAAKPMLVTLPFLLLVLDRWPFARRPSRPFLEKLPWFALAAASCWLTVVAQSRGDAIDSLENVPLGYRLGNAASAYLDYARLAAWPSGLAVFYPYPTGGAPVAKVVGGIALLAAGTVVALATRRSRPWILAGWLWWVGTLVPVIGIVQVGGQARADRYTYVPLVGLAIAVVFTIDVLVAGDRARRTIAAALGAGSIAAFGVATWIQVGVWRSDRTLFEHALRVTRDNYVAHFQLGYDYAHENRIQESLEQYAACVRLLPDYDRAHNDYGAALMVAGRWEQAAREFREALRCDPNAALVHFNLAGALLRLDRKEEAIASLEKGLELEPSNEARRKQLEDLRRGYRDR